jgi:NTE family protein
VLAALMLTRVSAVARIGLVLGAGGAVGHAFHAGVVAGLADATGWDARDAEVIVGTSAGSIVGAILRAGGSPPDIFARATGGDLSAAGRVLLARADAHTRGLPGIPERAPRRRFSAMSSPRGVANAVLRPWPLRPGALAAAALPAGSVSTELVAAGLRALFVTWPEAPLWITAVALDSGRRVTFGRDDTEADVASAVAASCAIPAFFEPVVIDGVRYVDGGVHSPTNADLLADCALDLVIVSSPMSIARGAARLAPDQPARRIARLALGREVQRLQRRGTPVLTFQPTRDDLAVMGFNAMDERRRSAVATQVRQSARRRLVRADARERVLLLTSSASATR